MLLLSLEILSANFLADFSFAYGGDSDNIDKNFLRNDAKDIVLDKKSNKLYYDGKPSAKMNYSSAIKYCQEMKFQGMTDWRVPTKDELISLLELSRSYISIKHAFKNVQQGIYWSSTKDRRGEAWYVDFDLGRYSTRAYEYKYYVLCVKEVK